MKKFLVSIALVLLTFVGVALLGAQGVEHSRGNLFSNLFFSPDNTYDIGASSANRPANVYVATNVQATNFFAGASGSRTKYTSTGDGVGLLTNVAGTDFTRLQFGGTTSAFPSLKRNGTIIEAKLADDSGYASLTGNAVNFTGNIQAGGVRLISVTAPTISSGFGTSPSIAFNNGTAAFRINVGTGGAATNGVIGLPTATTGWNCYTIDTTAATNHTGLQTVQTASTTTSATIESQNSAGTATAWAASSVVAVSCFAF
jgi:hypothetical protein